ncbi:S-layer homology domain-containing protein [Paenibacillus barengoltzii]|uniref:S-layer homology domain-containing protein n=1 Tax=Paenibacillus barengoltzii TaxID=343517 RepID=UPI000FDCC2AB|nr:S-layer homology domain-containing protein [Paenibacillus barengoltzii]
MSNTSYSFKENSHVIVNQGGEKKVMKKILSVALSTAMAFSMFASVAFGADAKLTPEQQFNALKEAGIVSGFPDGLSHLERTLTRAELAKIIVNSLSLEPVDATSYNDKNYANHWGRPYIEAATQAGILNGKDAVKKLFDPNGAVTVQELAKVLVTALKLEVPADANNTASEWAKGYVAAAVNAGYLADGINYQAQATRSQAVVAAYAIYEAAQVPTVKSYKVLDSKNVEFTLSNGEVVKVTLEKELEANKETEVTFKTADGKEITAKVTYVVTAATKVESVSADNLKQITVKFDGEVDKASAEAISNYKLNREIKSAELSSDARSVVLTLEGEYYSANGGNQLVNQTETKITVDGVKSSDKTRTLKQEVKFTPVDVTTPAVKEVVGLGTKAIKVVFSEPIDRATASASSNYKIDGKSIAGYVEYAFPNSVIITTDTEVGDHKLTVSNVQDFSGLKVVPVETSFSVAEDKEAPAVVKAESSDLTKVTIEFDEPVKSVSKIYNGISSKTGDVTLDKASNKVTVKFTKANALSVGENTIVIEGVTDYSGNSANREVKITPELDTARPEVTGVSVEVNSAGNHVLKVKYSEPVYDGDTNTTGAKQANYTVKDKDGKVVVGKGLDASGHPVKAITFNSDKDEATIELSGKLDKGTYTLEVSGVQDNAYVPNTILPVSKTFEVGDTSALTVTRFWVEEQNTTTTKRDVYFYVMFSKPVATSGVGSATEIAKYIIDWGTGAGFEALPSDASVELVTPEVAKIIVPYTDKAINRTSNYNTVQLKVSLIADQDGNFAYKDSGSISPAIGTDYANITVSEVNATAKDKITVKFAGKLINVDANEFQLQSATVTSDTYGLKLTGYSYDGGNTIANFTLVDGEKIAAKADVKLVAKGTIANTKDAFNNVVAIAAPITVNDKIKPSVVKPSDSKPFVLSGPTTVATGEEYTATVKFDEAINVVPGTGVVKVSVTGTDLVSTAYAVGTNPDELVVTFVTENALANDAVVSIELLSSNGDAKAVTDASTNAVDSFTLSGVVNRLR